MTTLKIKLITGRSLGQGRAKEAGKFTSGYRENVSVCELDPNDLTSLGVKPGSNVKVKTAYGSLIFRVESSKQSPHGGIAFIPYGPWASRITSPKTQSSGMPSLKGIEAEITPAKRMDILSLDELVEGKGEDQR